MDIVEYIKDLSDKEIEEFFKERIEFLEKNDDSQNNYIIGIHIADVSTYVKEGSELDKEAYNNVLYRLMLEEIMNLEKVEVSEKEAEKEAEELSKKYKMEKEEFLKQFGGIEMIQYDLEMRKVVELLKEANK